jgi:hypothetical protein
MPGVAFLRAWHPISRFRAFVAARSLGGKFVIALGVIGVLAFGASRYFRSSPAAEPSAPTEPVSFQAPSLPVGRLSATNRSHQFVKITSQSWTDGTGETVTRKVSWALEPGESLPLQVDGKGLLARSFAYTCTTTHVSRDLSATYDGGDVLAVEVTDTQVAQAPPPSPPVPTSPPPAPPPPAPTPRPVVVEQPTIKFEPKFELPRPAPKRSADIIIKSVSVEETDENGAAWDESGPPDPKVYIEVSSLFGASYTTSVKHDTSFASFNEKSIHVQEGDLIKIIVYDADVFADDTIGTYSKIITADTLKERTVDWSFGRVRSLQLEFQP